MRQHELAPPKGAKHARKRVGRGNGNGHGTYSGKGMKGQKARSGPGINRYFEGGQLPLSKRLPRKRGFTSLFRVEYETVNLHSLNRFAPETQVTPELLHQTGLVRSSKKPVKVLGSGELTYPLVVKAHRFSQSAKDSILAAGGQVEEIGAEVR